MLSSASVPFSSARKDSRFCSCGTQMNQSTGVGGDGGKQQGKGREEVDRGQPYARRIPQQMRPLGCDCSSKRVGWWGAEAKS